MSDKNREDIFLARCTVKIDKGAVVTAVAPGQTRRS